VAADVYRLPFVPGLFDAATMIRVLHHMADAPLALRQIRSVLQPGATFILEYANKLNLKAIVRYLIRRQGWSPFSPEPVEFVALNFDFHPRTVRRWLADVGFTVRRQLTCISDRGAQTFCANPAAGGAGSGTFTGDCGNSPAFLLWRKPTQKAHSSRERFCCPACKAII
jgi:SAM-dependent methyltransferase